MSVTLVLIESQEADVSTKIMRLEQARDWARFMTGVATTTAHGLSARTFTVVPVEKGAIDWSIIEQEKNSVPPIDRCRLWHVM